MANPCNPPDLKNIFADVGFDRVTLSTVETVDPDRIENENHPEGPISLEDLTTQVSINCYIRERVSAQSAAWYQQGDILNYLRLRVLVCVGDRNPPGLDYITQRFNEYQDLQGKFIKNGNEYSLSPTRFIQRGVLPPLRRVGSQTVNGQTVRLVNNSFLLATKSGTGFYMPYQSADPTTFLRNDQDEKQGYQIYGSRLGLSDLIVYDMPLADILPQRLNPDTQENEVISRSIRETTPANEDTGTPTMMLFEQSPVKPIQFRMGPGTDIGYTYDILQNAENILDHLSLYGFVYLDYTSYQEAYGLPNDGGANRLSLETGTGQTTAITLIGDKYIYTPITPEKGIVPRRIDDILDAPDVAILQDLRVGKAPFFSAGSQNYYQDAYVDFEGSALGKDATGKSIHREDFFTDFWASRDFENSTRYLVGFNVTKFLAQKSQFPGLYTNPFIVNELLSGFTFSFRREDDKGLEDDMPPEYRSGVKDFRVGRRFVDPLSFYNYNDLGTLSANKPKDPSHTYRLRYLDHPKSVSFTLKVDTGTGTFSDPARAGFHFYEGTDQYKPEQVNNAITPPTIRESEGRYQYFCEASVIDVAPIFLLKATKDLRNASNQLENQLNQLLDPIYEVYNPVENNFSKPLSDVFFQEINAQDHALEQLNVYIHYLRLFDIQIQRPGARGFRRAAFEAELFRLITHAKYPEDLSLVIRYIKVFASDIAALANVYYNVQMGYQEEADFAKRDALLKGLFEHEFAVLSYTHYFNNTYDFGIKNDLGYSYVGLDDNDLARGDHIPDGRPHIGLGIYSTTKYVNRINDEINKYYYNPHKVGSRLTVESMPREWNSSLYKFLTPRVIKAQGTGLKKDPIVQTSVAPSNVLEYDIDLYASVFADIIKSKYANKYLNYVFYKNEDELQNDDPNVRIYNSLLKVLGQEFSCDISIGTQEDYEIPTNKVFPDPMSGQTAAELPGSEKLARGMIDTSAIFNPQGIMGGRGDQSAQTQAIIEGIQSKYVATKNQENKDDGLKYTYGGKQSPELPVKLVFGILGEIELNNIQDNHTYQQDLFNSLVRLSDVLGVNEHSVANDIVGRYRDLPLQTKAMLVMSLMTQRINMNEIAVKRFRASDHDAVTEDMDAIRYYDDRTNPQIINPPYKPLYDPMKTYAKFLPFWLNFKKLIKIEYLERFGSTNAPISSLHPFSDEMVRSNSPSLPVWKELTVAGYEQMTFGQPGKKILCRVVNINAEKMRTPDESQPGNNDGFDDPTQKIATELKLVDAFKTHEVLDLPVYHQYFFLGGEGVNRR